MPGTVAKLDKAKVKWELWRLPTESVRAAAAARGIDYIRIPANGHPTPAASEIIAEILAAAVPQPDGSSLPITNDALVSVANTLHFGDMLVAI
jgi:hypothetical protein